MVNYMLILRSILPCPPSPLCHCHHHHHNHYHLHSTINLLVRCGMFPDYRRSCCWGFFRHTALHLILYCLPSQVLEHNLNSVYACAGLTPDCWVIHDWLQRDGDDQETLVSVRFYVRWIFRFGRSVNHGCWTLWQACDWVERSEINYLMSGFASKCLPASLSVFWGLGEYGVYQYYDWGCNLSGCLAHQWSLCW
jgi:hypothetical protein